MSKPKDDNVTSAVLGYLVKQNRPYSAIDIFNNLHKAHGKTLQLPVISDAELKEMDLKIEKLQEKLKFTEDSYRKLDSELRSLNSSMTTKDAKERLQQLSSEVSII
ncbi:hypothetical protein LSH36_200g01017, partial [Paralvinella palmiformis]